MVRAARASRSPTHSDDSRGLSTAPARSPASGDLRIHVHHLPVRDNVDTADLEHPPALRRVGDLDVSTRWTDAGLFGRTPADPIPTDPEWAGATILTDRQVVRTSVTAEALFRRSARAWASAAASRRDACARRCVARVVDHPRARRRAVRSACRVFVRAAYSVGSIGWYSVAPFHRFIFGPLALGIEQHAAKALTGSLARAA